LLSKRILVSKTPSTAKKLKSLVTQHRYFAQGFAFALVGVCSKLDEVLSAEVILILTNNKFTTGSGWGWVGVGISSEFTSTSLATSVFVNLACIRVTTTL